MSSILPPRSTVVLKANRDTVLLLAGATGLALAIGYSAHSRPAPEPASPSTEQVFASEWTGQLAPPQQAEATVPAPVETLSSAALTVPKAAMSLPTAPRPAAVPPKPRACEGAACPARIAAAAPAPVKRPVGKPSGRPVRDESLMARLNPLNHIPDLVKRPFAIAGDTVSSWVKRF